MLTLTRKVGETIRIGDDIEIVVKEIRKNQVRIGIVAPREVKIFREEVYDNIVAERRTEPDKGEKPRPQRKSAARRRKAAAEPDTNKRETGN